MKFQKTLAVSKGKTIDFVAEGLPVTQDGYMMTEEQLNNIDAALVAGDSTAATLQTTQQELTAANAAKVKAEGELATANAKIVLLEKKDGAIPSGAHAAKDPVTDVKDDMKEFETPYDREMAAYLNVK